MSFNPEKSIFQIIDLNIWIMLSVYNITLNNSIKLIYVYKIKII